MKGAATAANAPLIAIKAAHTLVWVFFVACILAIWIGAWAEDYGLAAGAALIVLLEVAALMLNRWQFPLSPIAARYTQDRRVNFDIYLPAWLAGRTKSIFGPLYLAGSTFALARWALAAL